MSRARVSFAAFAAVALLMLPCLGTGAPPEQPQGSAPPAARDLFVTVGKSLVVESPVNIQRVSVADGKKAEALAVAAREVLVNGIAPGETSLIIWQAGGNRLLFDLKIQPNTARIDNVRQELAKELPGQDVTVTEDNGNVFVRGTVDSLFASDRAIAIAKTLGTPVNLLRVKVPTMGDQVLLKVRFADVDRSATQQLGFNLFSTGATNTIGQVSTGAFTPPTVNSNNGNTNVTFTDQLNLLLFRPDLNLGATIKALENKAVLQILAEPNLLTESGKEAKFLAGGELPIPMVQSSAAGNAITVSWREYGIKLTFLPTITPRGTVHLKVTPEVSSIDTANGVTLSGFSIPAISTRRVQTEIELEDGQSFAIAGLLDNRVQDSFSKVPGIGDIPVLGKLFQSRDRKKSNSELLVVVTPELVKPIPAGQTPPDVKFPQPFLKDTPTEAPRTPPISVTGKKQSPPARDTMPVEELQELQKQGQPPQDTQATPMVLVPLQQTQTQNSGAGSGSTASGKNP